jgi:hypothetical protein
MSKNTLITTGKNGRSANSKKSVTIPLSAPQLVQVERDLIRALRTVWDAQGKKRTITKLD